MSRRVLAGVAAVSLVVPTAVLGSSYVGASAQSPAYSPGAVNAVNAVNGAGSAADVELKWKIVDSWGSGFQASAQLVNHSNRALEPWKVDVVFPHKVTSAWDTVTRKTVNGFSASAPSWAQKLSSSATASFGLVGTRSSTLPTAPT
ncbi:MAG: cellulose binding domain-containing protein, partial [Actinobacteria bacterium]|nr:cellulose binding domain-containing protein [Actinomycetota bacterium]